MEVEVRDMSIVKKKVRAKTGGRAFRGGGGSGELR